MASLLRIVVVLYQVPLRSLRPLLEDLRAASVGLDAVVTVVSNRDDIVDRVRSPRAVQLGQGLRLEAVYQHNRYGVAGAYNYAIQRAAPEDLLILLDGDARLGGRYFSEVASRRTRLATGICFATLEQFSGRMRVSPYAMVGSVPRPIDGTLAGPILKFADGVGVINSGLAGSVASFRAVDGFSSDMPLDLSDVVWSREAARKRAELLLLPMRHSHDLSMQSAGFSAQRLGKYLVACWRITQKTGDVMGGLRLTMRGLRAFRWSSLWT